MMSSFFRALRASYQAEIDDLSSDSEGRDVLRQRLTEKRSQLTFLLQMIETSPEMVAVALHRGFHFELPAVMDQLLTLEPDEFPDWSSLADAVQLTPWAQDLSKVILQQPKGDWFMTVAAGLEYLYQRPASHHHEGGLHGEQNTPCADEHGHRSPARRNLDHGHDFDADDEHQHHAHDHEHEHEDASADWLEGQGFDRKN